jgi:outer membrane protein with beta-barrel domain
MKALDEALKILELLDVVPMKRSIVASFSILFLFAAHALHSQVVPAATSSSLALDAGGFGSVSQPDYAGEGIAQTSPNRLYGAGAYVDGRISRWVQLEGEGRWLKFNQYLGINESTYLVGPRVPIRTFYRITPYGKVLVGLGSGSFLSGHSLVLAYGGGFDYHVTRRFSARADFEYQQWEVTPTLWPYGVSLGVSYRVFGPH